MGVYKRGRILWIRYADPSGEIVRESTDQADRRTAARLYRQRKREVADGTWIAPRSRSSMKVSTFASTAPAESSGA